MKVLILRSIVFNDEITHPLIDDLVEGYRTAGHQVAVYNMPAADNIEHWAGYSIADYNSFTDLMICIDFPTALIQHKKKRIILTKKLPESDEFQQAIGMTEKESIDIFDYSNSNKEYNSFPTNITDYISCMEVK